jgi:Xaa-Pro aminopeptidase
MRDIAKPTFKIGPALEALNLPPNFPEHSVPDDAVANKVLLDYVPRIPISERDRRWSEMRKRMTAAKVEVLILLGNDIYWDMGYANIRYLSGTFSKISSHMIFPRNGDPILWADIPHMNRPYNMALSVSDWVQDVRGTRGLAEICATVKDLGLARGRVALVGFSNVVQSTATLLYDDVLTVKRLLPDAQFVDFAWVFEDMRMVKSEAEIAMQRHAGKIHRETIDVMTRSCRPGVRESEVYADMLRHQIASGADPNIFYLFGAGPVEHHSNELWSLLHGQDVPRAPTMRPLAEGDLVIAEFHTRYGGYNTHAEYTVYVGDNVPQQLLNIWSVCVETLDVARTVLRTGTTLREAWTAIRKPCADARMDFVELGFHAKGIASPEFPAVVYKEGYFIGANGLGHENFELRNGMTLGVNIDIFDPRWKHDVGCMYGDFLVVRDNGTESLIDPPREIGRGGQ